MNRILVSLFVLFSGFVLVSSCNKDKNATDPALKEAQIAKEDSIFNLVMNVHDEVMPLTSTLVKRIELLEEMEEMDSLQTTLLSELKTGKEAMWDWMYAIKAPKKLRDSLSHEKIVSYLVNEQASIDEVKRLMIEAKNNSEVLYEE